MKVVVFAMVNDSSCVAKVVRAVDCVDVPGCATGWCKVDEVLYGASGVQIRVEVRLFVLDKKKKREKADFLRWKIESICSKYFY